MNRLNLCTDSLEPGDRRAGPWLRLSLALSLAGPLLSQAQPAPDAGAVRQQIEQQRELPLPPVVRPPKVAPPEAQPKDGMSVSVKAFSLAGNNLLGSEQLLPALTEFLNRPLDFEGLQRAADAVAAVYREAGWVVRVYLPEQDVSEGRVRLQVVEASYAGLRFEGESSQLISRQEIEAYFASGQQVGEPLNATRLDRALLLTDDLAGVSVVGTLAAGEQDGQTALVLQTTDEPFVYGDATLDNTGSRSTGEIRLSVNLSINSPFGRGDLLSLNALRTEGSEYGRVGLTLPVGRDGLRVGVNASDMIYKVIAGDNKAAEVKGGSGSVGWDLNYPMVRGRQFNLYLSMGADKKNFRTEAGGKLPSDYGSSSQRVGLSSNWFDGLAGGGANSAFMQLTEGRLVNMAAHTALDTIRRDYRKVTYSLSRQQAISGAHSVYALLTGQYAEHQLDSSERFYLGGASSVRAYPSSEQGGDKGQLITIEWRWRLDADWVLTAFTDQGRVQALIPKVNPGDGDPVALRGRGLSLSWRGPMGLTPKLTWSQRNSSNPRPYQNRSDSDGTLKLDRFWLSVGLAF